MVAHVRVEAAERPKRFGHVRPRHGPAVRGGALGFREQRSSEIVLVLGASHRGADLERTDYEKRRRDLTGKPKRFIRLLTRRANRFCLEPDRREDPQEV